MSSTASRSVIVGIDGSHRATKAALWAVNEAVRRDEPLRLIYVIRTDLTGTLSAAEYRTVVDDAKKTLSNVREAIGEVGEPVRVETSIVQGSPAGVLIAESTEADLICVGASGMGRVGRAVLGSTATSVAEGADCSVAIVQPEAADAPTDDRTPWVIVPVSAYTEDASLVIDDAVAEARLRGWAMLVVGVRHPDFGSTPHDTLDGIVSDWRSRFSDVHMYPVSVDTGITHFLRSNPDIGGLVVVAETSASDVASMIGGEHRHGHREAERGVLIVRR